MSLYSNLTFWRTLKKKTNTIRDALVVTLQDIFQSLRSYFLFTMDPKFLETPVIALQEALLRVHSSLLNLHYCFFFLIEICTSVVLGRDQHLIC
jgi:hypothetical protein